MSFALSSLLRPSPIASSSRLLLPRIAAPLVATTIGSQVRFRGQLAPKRTKYRKSQKGHPHIPTGGSLKGTTLEHGDYGIRVLASTRLTADQLTSAQNAIKRKIKPVKGANCYLRVFPDVPVCVKGNETRMGKGKGSFEYWACRVPVGRVIFEVGGGNIREEIAKQGEPVFQALGRTPQIEGSIEEAKIRRSYAALKLAQVKLPVGTEFITTTSAPRLGSITSSLLAPPPSALPSPAKLAELDAKNEGSAVGVILEREERRMEEMVKGLEGLAVEKGSKPAQEARS